MSTQNKQQPYRFGEKLRTVRGNCDAEVDQWLVDFPIISEMGCIMIDGISMYITHGHKYNYENKPSFSRTSKACLV